MCLLLWTLIGTVLSCPAGPGSALPAAGSAETWFFAFLSHIAGLCANLALIVLFFHFSTRQSNNTIWMQEVMPKLMDHTLLSSILNGKFRAQEISYVLLCNMCQSISRSVHTFWRVSMTYWSMVVIHSLHHEKYALFLHLQVGGGSNR
jgi:hypothetical protein